jgi:hypothetical protein
VAVEQGYAAAASIGQPAARRKPAAAIQSLDAFGKLGE